MSQNINVYSLLISEIEPVTSPEVVKFVAYLESVFAVENFHFLKEVSAFQLECAHGTAKSKERKAKKIYETFFSESSPSLINMSHKSALPVHTRFGPLPSTIFDLAVKQVRLNLQVKRKKCGSKSSCF